MVTTRSHFIDVAGGMQISLSGPWTNLAGGPPLLGGPDGGIPKRPGTALNGTNRVDPAPFGLRVEENAITVAEFLETATPSNLANIAAIEFRDIPLGH